MSEHRKVRLLSASWNCRKHRFRDLKGTKTHTKGRLWSQIRRYDNTAILYEHLLLPAGHNTPICKKFTFLSMFSILFILYPICWMVVQHFKMLLLLLLPFYLENLRNSRKNAVSGGSVVFCVACGFLMGKILMPKNA